MWLCRFPSPCPSLLFFIYCVTFGKTQQDSPQSKCLPFRMGVRGGVHIKLQYQKHQMSHQCLLVNIKIALRKKGKIQPRLACCYCAKQQCPTVTKHFQMWNELSVECELRVGCTKVLFCKLLNTVLLISNMYTYISDTF